MSRKDLQHSKTLASFPLYKIGNISKEISQAFGNPALFKRPAIEELPQKKLLILNSKPIGKNVFLTHTDLLEVDADPIVHGKSALSYEEMILEMDSLSSSIKSSADSLSLLRKKIAKCQAGIRLQETNCFSLHNTVKKIDSKNKLMLQRFKSMCTIPKPLNN